MKSLLPFFMPTKVFLIDDNYEILRMLKSNLNRDIATYNIFDNPFTAIQTINQNAIHDFSKKVKQKEEYLLNGDINSFYSEIYDKARFEQVSAIIVDYDMPGINGIELCKAIHSPYIKKIMLTGAASEKLAIEAFNHKIIDYFIQKEDPEFLEKLEVLIAQTQNQYLHSITNGFTNIAYYKNLDSMGITDPIFMNFFHNLIKEKNVCEYYLLDSIGTYLFLSDEGDPSALFILDEYNIMGMEDYIPEAEQTQEIIDNIYNFKKAICYYQFEDMSPYDETKWKDYLFSLHPLQGRQTYYWAYVPVLPYLNKDAIVSFKKYKKGLEHV